MFSCDVVYDNPNDPTEVGEDTVFADVPELEDLILNATGSTLSLVALESRTANGIGPTGTLGMDGTDTVFIGGTVDVPIDTVSGRYSGQVELVFTQP